MPEFVSFAQIFFETINNNINYDCSGREKAGL